MVLNITVLPGDGIGPEVMDSAVRVLSAVCEEVGLELKIVSHDIGGVAINRKGSPLPDETLLSCRNSHGVLLGAVGGPEWDGESIRPEQGLLALRSALGLFANLRPIRIYNELEHLSPVKSCKGMDILIVRELTGGIYFGDREEGSAYASDLCAYSSEEVIRLLEVAFQAAQGRRKKLTSVDKANVLASSRLWRHHADHLSNDYPDIQLDHTLVDAMAMHLVTKPSEYDVIVTENMFGDILSDEAAAISGSIGLAASASLGKAGMPGVYEPIHGSAPDISGQGIANPAGMILSAAMLMRHGAQRPDIAEVIENAVEMAIRDGVLTRDLGGDCGTLEMTEAVLAKIKDV